METQNKIHEIEKQALVTFVVLAGFGLAAAMYYCYATNRFMEMGLVGASVVLLGILVVNTYRSFSKGNQNH